jgi:hypothetical protein
MIVEIPRSDTVKIYEDWILIAVKTDRKLQTYSFLAINTYDEIEHISEDQYKGVEDAIAVAEKFVDLEETKRLAR